MLQSLDDELTSSLQTIFQLVSDGIPSVVTSSPKSTPKTRLQNRKVQEELYFDSISEISDELDENSCSGYLDKVVVNMEENTSIANAVIKPDYFYGKPGEDIQTYLRAFDGISEVNSWSDNKKKYILGALFRGASKLWYDTLSRSAEFENLSYNQFKDKAKAAFKDLFDIRETEDELRSTSQESDESVFEYITKKRNLISKLDPTMEESKQVKIIVEGLQPDLLRDVAKQSFASVDLLLQYLRRTEKANKLADRKTVELFLKKNQALLQSTLLTPGNIAQLKTTLSRSANSSVGQPTTSTSATQAEESGKEKTVTDKNMTSQIDNIQKQLTELSLHVTSLVSQNNHNNSTDDACNSNNSTTSTGGGERNTGRNTRFFNWQNSNFRGRNRGRYHRGHSNWYSNRGNGRGNSNNRNAFQYSRGGNRNSVHNQRNPQDFQRSQSQNSPSQDSNVIICQKCGFPNHNESSCLVTLN